MSELGVSEDDAHLLYYFIMGGAVHTLEAYVKENLRISREELAHKMNELVISAQKALISRN